MGLIFALFLIIAFGAVAYFDLTQTPGFNPATFMSGGSPTPAPRVTAAATPARPQDAPANNDDRPV